MRRLLYGLLLSGFFESFGITEFLLRLENDLKSLKLSRESTQKSWEMGSWLLGKHMKDILSKGQMRVAGVDKNPHQPIIVAYDAVNNIFQLYVLEQKFQTCSLHALRNFLYCMHALENTEQAFPAWYTTMLSQQNYDQFQQQWCPLTQRKYVDISTYTRIIDDLKKADKQTLFQLSLPSATAEYLNKFLSLDFYFNVLEPFPEKRIQTMQKELGAVEPSLSREDVQRIYLLGKHPIDQIHNFFIQVERMRDQETYTFGCELGVFTLMQHATTLVINKVHKKIACIFMDSYFNSSFTQGSFAKQYQEAIITVLKYVRSRELLEKDAIRFIYSDMLFGIAGYVRRAEKDAKNLLKIPEQFEGAYTKLATLKLFMTPLYRIVYKKMFLNALQLYEAQYPHNAYQAIIQKFNNS